MKLALVYLGSNLPKYVLKNLKYIQQVFPNQKLVFIGDHEEIVGKVAAYGIETFKAEDSSSSWSEVQKTMSHPMSFREGFWFTTTARFEALSQYMNVVEESVLQIEADVWISPDFPFNKFEVLDAHYDIDIAFPLQTEKTGSGSVLWLKSGLAARQLVEITEDSVKLDPTTTDMYILGRIANEGLMQVGILPTRSSAENLNNTSDTRRSDNYQALEEHFFEGIFDALTIGFFLLGEDPRNNRGIRKLFYVPAEHLCDPRTLNLKLNDLGFLEATLNNGNTKVHCLHNHSKDLRLFEPGNFKLIKKRLSQMASGQKSEFLPSIFARQVYQSLTRRISGLVKN